METINPTADRRISSDMKQFADEVVPFVAVTNGVIAVIVKDRNTVGQQTGNSFLVKESG